MGYVCVTLGALMMAFADIEVKRLLDAAVPPVDIVATRNVAGFGFLALYAAVAAPRTLKVSKKDLPFLMGFGTLGIALTHFCGINSIKINSVSTAIVLLYTSPVFILLWSALSRRAQVFRYEIVATAVVIVGVALAFQAYSPEQFRLNRLGLGVGLASAAAYAFATICGKKGLLRHRHLTLSVYGIGFAACLWLVTGYPLQVWAAHYPAWVWGKLALVALLGTLFMPVLYLLGLRTISPAEANLTASLEQPFAMGLSYTFLQERFELPQLLGLGLIVVGVAYLQVRGMKRNKSSRTQTRSVDSQFAKGSGGR
jgi:drug/metabolite transporter (DMT)-like permease